MTKGGEEETDLRSPRAIVRNQTALFTMIPSLFGPQSSALNYDGKWSQSGKTLICWECSFD